MGCCATSQRRSSRRDVGGVALSKSPEMGKNRGGRQDKRNQARKDKQESKKAPARRTNEKADPVKQLGVALILIAMAGVALFKTYLMVADAGGLSYGSHVTRVSVSDEKMLKRVFKDPEPWVVVCNPEEATDRSAGARARSAVAARRALRVVSAPLGSRASCPRLTAPLPARPLAPPPLRPPRHMSCQPRPRSSRRLRSASRSTTLGSRS